MPQLLERLILEFPDSSKSNLRKWIKAGRIAVDGIKSVEPHLEVNDSMVITLKDKKNSSILILKFFMKTGT